MLRVIFPQHYQVEVNKLRQQLDETHIAWWKEWKAQQPDFVIENIRFEHRPGWDKKFLSIQSAHNLNHWAWKATAVAWVAVGGAL